jgi:hypothetical protein
MANIRTLKAQAAALNIANYWQLPKAELQAAIEQAQAPTPRQQALGSLGQVRSRRTPYGTVLIKGGDAIALAPITTWPTKFWIVLAAAHLGLTPRLHLYGKVDAQKIKEAVAACHRYGIRVSAPIQISTQR